MSTAVTTPSFIHSQALIGGQWISAQDKRTYPVYNPANGELIIDVPDMSTEDTRRAIEHAVKAQQTWQEQTAKERANILTKWGQLVDENKEALAQLLTLEQGKTLAQSRGEIASSVAYIDWFANEAMRINGEVLPASTTGNFEFVQKRPVGVVGAITPWNFPNSMIARKVAPALAAGCAVVIKPAEDTPLSALALAELAQQAGLPDGVLNVVTAQHGQDVGKELCSNPDVRKLSFTGSTAVGKKLYEQCAPTVKKLSLELGGNAPFIVFDDADLDVAIQGAVTMKFYNTGQACICVNRLFVHENIHDAFVDKLSQHLHTLTMGAGTDPDVTHGPVINKQAIKKITSIVDGAVEQGAHVSLGGQPKAELGENFFDFTILTQTTPEMDIFSTEIFGPVAAIYSFSTEEEVLELANRTNYGLAAYFYTKDTARIFRLSSRLEYGMVGVNTIRFVSETMPFGGVKESGLGREGSHHGIDEFLEMHYVCINS